MSRALLVDYGDAAGPDEQQVTADQCAQRRRAAGGGSTKSLPAMAVVTQQRDGRGDQAVARHAR